jgi:hypothetical protein
MAPTALPEGVSPDNQEMMFQPGSAYSRAGLSAVFESPFATGGPENFTPTIVYGKSLVTSSGAIQNLYFDSNGAMWMEDWSNSPGTYTLLFQSTPGSFCKSVTCFGREYIAISDGLHGSDIPYQWDGTTLLRVTQDGPGAPPNVSSVALTGSALAGSGSTPSSGSVTSVTLTAAGNGYGIPGNTLPLIFTGGSGSGAAGYGTVGYLGSISGITLTAGGTGYTSTPVVSISGSGGGFSATATISSSGGGGGTTSLSRLNNLVTGYTTAAHNLQVGYQMQISGVTSLPVGGGITSIVINNEDNPGLATVTTNAAHGLVPGNDVTVTGVSPVSVGGSWSASWDGSTTTMTSSSPHGLVPGAVISISGGSGATAVFNTSSTVALVLSPSTIAFSAAYLGTAPLTATGLTVSISWPVPDNTPTPTYFEVVSSPSPTTFQIEVTYSDATWTNGTVSFAWDGTFFVSSVPSPTTFTYTQYGPAGLTTSAGKATPFGQCAPGLHLVQVMFQRADGTITKPSPPATFIANGGQYPSLTDIPIGPSDVVARIVQFTGAQPLVPGILPPFFYIAVPAQDEGQIVSTATVIYDNTTESAIFDFSDNTLFGTAASGGATSIVGNNLVAQIKLDGALGFGYWDSRLATWGQRNAIQELLGMGFGSGESGRIAPGIYLNGPLGWTVPTNSVHGSLQQQTWDGRWTIAAHSTDTAGTSGLIQQGAYQDAYGNPICDPNTQYKIRFKIVSVTGIKANISLSFFLSSALTSFNSVATFSGASISAWQAANGGYFEAVFDTRLGTAVPSDLQFGFYATSSAGTVTIAVTDLSLIDAENPYLDNQSFTSYANNPNGFDGVTGNSQPTEDTRKIMDFSITRDTIYCHTQDPSGRLHEITINPTSEPNGWEWREVASNCGALSAFCVTHSQADDASASGGEDWVAWASESGAVVFDGTEPKKVSQEIQPNWNAPYSAYPWIAPNSQINFAAAYTISCLNDPVERMLYFFLPIGAATAPSLVYPMSYRELNGAYAIANSPPFHPSLAGRLIATDNTRKWTIWRRTLNGAARMYRQNSGQLTTVFFGGNGQTPGAAAGYGNLYSLNPAKLTDDDYGQINPYYVTSFFLDAEKAQALQLSFVRLLCCYANIFIQGVGNVTYTILCDAMDNPWSITTTRALSSTPKFEQEFAGNQAQGGKMALKIASSPATGTDNSFNLQRVNLWFRKAKLQLRGAAQ